MKYFSMFSGIGGFELGIQQAYESNINKELWEERQNKGSLLGHDKPDFSSESDQRQSSTCIGYSEIDKYAIQIYERHFNHKNYGDATTINPSEPPDFDLLVGGFPCQAFSIAGKRGGLEDSRGTLFYDIARIAKEKRPQHLLLENVKGLLSHDFGRTFKLIITTFAELGYNLEWQVLNSKNFGVPQNRERVFIIGHLGECCGRQVFPITGENPTVSEILETLRIQGLEPTEKGFESLTTIPVLTPDRPQKRQNGRRFKEDGDPSFTLTAQDKHGIYDGMRIRRLTPTECERLQAYPDGWTEGVSDTQRYKTLGNAVTVNVIEYLIKQLYESRN